jgi:hypothetical protein
MAIQKTMPAKKQHLNRCLIHLAETYHLPHLKKVPSTMNQLPSVEVLAPSSRNYVHDFDRNITIAIQKHHVS